MLRLMCAVLLLFQSTLPREERLSTASARLLLSTYFNPRSHERSDQVYAKAEYRKDISIHAPTRGATIFFNIMTEFLSYFNPRSHERSDRRMRLLYRVQRYFNPRSHERSDAIRGLFLPRGKISIHAPTRGATIEALHGNPFRKVRFQSTLPREERR